METNTSKTDLKKLREPSVNRSLVEGACRALWNVLETSLGQILLQELKEGREATFPPKPVVLSHMKPLPQEGKPVWRKGPWGPCFNGSPAGGTLTKL